jgi:hypothetical protein
MPHVAVVASPQATQPEVVLHGQFGDHAATLGHVRHAAPHKVLNRYVDQFGAVEEDPSGARPQQAGQRPEQRRLAGAVGPEDGADGARRDVEVDVVQNRYAVVAGDEAGDLQQGAHGRTPLSASAPR